MPRYSDADKLYKDVLASWDKDKHVTLEASRVHRQEHQHLMRMIEKQPTADVVPKSELEISQHLLKDAWKRIEELDELCGELQRKYDMAERKFADEEIIKALEWCIQNNECEYCEYREKTDKSDICPIRMDALNLINKQNAEIETLKDNNEHLAVILEETKAEVERLQAEKDALIKNYAECMKDYSREIFAEIEKHLIFNAYGIATISDKTFAKLKKKYTEGE